jgi:uncharacterized protein YkwD
MNAVRSVYSRRDQSVRAMNGAFAESCALSYPAARSGPATMLGRMGLWWLIGLALIWSAFLLTTRPAAARTIQTFVPLVITDTTGPGGSGNKPAQCGLNEQEQAIADLMINDPGQQRKSPVCDATLAQVARARARDMALRGYFSHTNPDGDGPNLLVREAGYPLPDWYSSEQDANSIESIGGGYPTAAGAWQGWLKSPSHHAHVLGTEDFYAEQNAYGVGFYANPDSPYGYYWVFISAPAAD